MSDLVIVDDILPTLSNLEISEDTPRVDDKEALRYNGPVGNYGPIGQILPKSKTSNGPRSKRDLDSAKRTARDTSRNPCYQAVNHVQNHISDSQLGLTNDEIALLRHYQLAAANSTRSTSSSTTVSIASSHGLLLLDRASLATLSRHFDLLLQQIKGRFDYLSESVQMSAQIQYDKAGNTIEHADVEIATLHHLLHEIDEVELDFDKLKNIRDIVRDYRSRVEVLERDFAASSHSQHQKRQNVQQSSREILQEQLQEQTSTEEQTVISTIPRIEITVEKCEETEVVNVAGMMHESADLGTICSSTDGSTTWSTSSNDSNDLGSDGSEGFCSTTDWRHHLILEVVMTDVYNLLNQRTPIVRGAYNQQGETSSGNSSSWTSGTFSSTNQSSISSTRNSAGTKRGNADDNVPPPDEDPDGNKRPRKGSKDDSEVRRYACPFFKNDPRYHKRKRSCAGPGFNSISHLKEHLYRCHIAPTQCPRCWLVVGDDRGLELHLRNDTQCEKQERKPVDGISPQKLKLLKSKKRLPAIEGADGSKWSDIYRILFPGVQPIPSPYYEEENDGIDSKAGSSSQLKDFGQYYRSRLPSLIEMHVTQLLHEKLQPVEAEMKSMVTEITGKCLSDLVRDWQASQSEINSEDEPSTNEADILRSGGDPGPSSSASISKNSDISVLDANVIAQAADNPYFDFTQLGDWTNTALLESQLMDSRSYPRPSSFVCLGLPQHPEPETYSGKGKGLESQEFKYCLECFPNA